MIEWNGRKAKKKADKEKKFAELKQIKLTN